MKNKVANGFELLQDLIKLRWVPEILKSIYLGNTRYTDILNSIPNMSHTELNRKLATLIDREVIFKEIDESNTEYGMLEFGDDLVHIFYHLEDLEAKYLKSPR